MAQNVKASLKEVRIHLKEQRFVEAMKLCQRILKADKNNYMALVMLAASVLEIEEHRDKAVVLLERAGELQPSNPIAWKGLISYYKTQPECENSQSRLVLAYCKLLQCNSQSEPFGEYFKEAVHVATRVDTASLWNTVLKSIGKLHKDSEGEERRVLDKILLQIFSNHTKLAVEHADLYESILHSILVEENIQERREGFRKYLQLLKDNEKKDELLAAAYEIHRQFPNDPYPLEWICQVYSERGLEGEVCESVDIKEVCSTLLRLVPGSYLAVFARGVDLWNSKNYVEARDALNQAVSRHPGLIQGWILLGEVNLRLYCWPEAESTALQALQLLEKNSTSCENLEDRRRKIQLVLVEAMARSSEATKWSRAALECQKLLESEDSERVSLLLGRVYALQGDERASELLAELESNEKCRTEAIIIRSLVLKNAGHYEEASEVLGSALETSEAWQILGEINWMMAEYGHSLLAFLKGVHTDPNNWHCLLYLGHYYRERGNDLDKSRKCYQKALRINPNSDEAGIGLSTAFRLLKNTEANMQMLQSVTTQNGGGPKWAWLQLGLQHLDQGEITQAIQSLRYVIRADPNDNHCWESLADAYLARGAHTSAIKSYERALELSPGALYPLIQMANIKVALGEHEEAKEDFGKILNQEPRYIPALKGLADTCLGLAKEAASQQLLGRARRHAQHATDSLTDALYENSELSCVWKLLGDACYMTAVLPDAYSFLEIAPGLVKSESTEPRIVIRKSELFGLATRCFCRALGIGKDSAFIWHDIACCYLSQMRLDESADHKAAASKSLAAAQQAVRLSPSSWMHWNLLAIICMTEEVKNYALAQHSCIMAIDREPYNAVAWTNLGALYLKVGEPYKANEAFSRAQRADPDYMNSWIGQGMIAEAMQRKEAMDLFRHATSIGYHGQAALGYAHWVLTTLLDPKAKDDPLYTYTIENLHAVAVATDAINWYIERVPNDSSARNALGLLLERQRLFGPASRQFREALKLEKDDANLDSVRINQSRVLVEMGELKEAIDVCQEVKTASFKSQCQLAIAFFKAKWYEESYEAYEATLNGLADNDSDKAHVLCAMAAIAYMFQEFENSKTLLFQCIQIQPPTVAGLLAAAALGLLEDDPNLTGLVLDELKPYKDDPDHRHHVAVLSAYSALLHGRVDRAIRVLSKAVHRHPDDVACWVALVKILLQRNSPRFASCAQKAMLLGRKTSAVWVSEVACVASLGDLCDSFSRQKLLDRETGNRGLWSVQKTLFSFPGNVESWANLVVALTNRPTCKAEKPDRAWISSLLSIVRKEMKSSPSMSDWLEQNETKVSRTFSAARGLPSRLTLAT